LAKVSLVSLGCPKNLVDSEEALGEIVQAGHELVTDKSRAKVIVINTCGFIEAARAESVEAILDALEYKRAGNCAAVIVVGCLSQRFGADLALELPELDAILGISHAGEIVGAIESALAGKRTTDHRTPSGDWVENTRRVRSTPPWTAYLKVSDGCDNRCSYCAIPDIRGPFRSRPERLVLNEAKRLADSGVRELVLVGQDLTKYGEDWERPNLLPGLLEELNQISGLRWIRLLYCYPTRVTPELVQAVAGLEKVVKYIDLPLQHGDDSILRAMNRRGTSEDYLRVIDELREQMPGIALRTSMIVGFPGETQTAFANLLRFVERIRFDRLGAFTYSREEGTPASRMRQRVSSKTAAARRDELMRLQQQISLERNRAFVGAKIEVLVEGRSEDSVFGRSYRDAPEIDGLVHVRGSKARPGEFVRATVTSADEYDLAADLVA